MRKLKGNQGPRKRATSVASAAKVKENDGHESEIESADRSGASRVASATVAQPAQYTGESSGGASESPAGARVSQSMAFEN